MSRVEPLVLRAGDEKVLKGLLRSSTVSAGLAQRARILLLAAEGHSNTEIGPRVGVSLPTVRLWRNRYATGGLEQLDDQPRSGRPAVHDEQVIIAATLEPPPAKLGVTHWSARLLADHLGISFATVARIWRRWGLKPWKAETFKFSTDPELEARSATSSGSTWPRQPTRSSSVSTKKPRSMPLTGPRGSCPCGPGSRRSRPTTTSATARPPSSRRSRSRPGW